MRDEGLLTFYELENVAEQGMMPEEKLVKIGEAFYANRTIGYNRRYAAQGANRQIDKLVRTYNTDIPHDGMYVILEDGLQYQIDSMSEIVDEDATDLTLVRIEDYYEVDAADSDEP